MKNLLIVVSVIFVLFTSCKKEEPIIYCSSASAMINGTAWSTNGLAGYDEGEETFTIIMNEIDEDGIWILSHAYANIPRRVGSYTYDEIGLSPWHQDEQIGASFHFLDDDVVLNSYILVETDTLNQFTIDSYNEETLEVEGSFRATFEVRQPNGFGFPDTIRITDGHFSTTIWL